MHSRYFIAAMLAFLPASGFAQDNCGDASSQTEMNICADKNYKKADAGLNAAYKEIMKRLSDDADSRKRLQTAQRAWIAFRDAECAFVNGQVLTDRPIRC